MGNVINIMDCDTGMNDMFMADSGQLISQESQALLDWRKQTDATLAERANKSSEEKSAQLSKAKEDREAFYAQRKLATDAANKSNRDEEALSKQSMEALA